MSKYRKFVVAAAGAAVTLVSHFFGVSSDAYFVTVTVLTAAGVYVVPNA